MKIFVRFFYSSLVSNVLFFKFVLSKIVLHSDINIIRLLVDSKYLTFNTHYKNNDLYIDIIFENINKKYIFKIIL